MLSVVGATGGSGSGLIGVSETVSFEKALLKPSSSSSAEKYEGEGVDQGEGVAITLEMLSCRVLIFTALWYALISSGA